MKYRCVDCRQERQAGAFAILEGSITGRACCCKDCMVEYETKRTEKRAVIARTVLGREESEAIKAQRRGVANSHNAAMKKVRAAIKLDRLKKKPCEKCGDKASQPCHPNTDFPLEVDWYCLRHHPFAKRCVRCHELRIEVDYPIARKNISCRSGVCKLCRKGEYHVVKRRNQRLRQREIRDAKKVAANTASQPQESSNANRT